VHTSSARVGFEKKGVDFRAILNLLILMVHSPRVTQPVSLSYPEFPGVPEFPGERQGETNRTI